MHASAFRGIMCVTVVKPLQLKSRYRTMSSTWRDHIESTPEVLRGKPRLKGTRIPVSLVLGHLAAKDSVDEIVRQFPDLNADHIAACLEYARDLADFETAVP